MNLVDDKAIVKEYFNNTGFDRWQRIYGDGEVNKVQLAVRIGHQQTVDTLLGWFEADGNLAGLSICDAGCGVGSLSIPLATATAIVAASDISEKMVEKPKNVPPNYLAITTIPTLAFKIWKVSAVATILSFV